MNGWIDESGNNEVVVTSFVVFRDDFLPCTCVRRVYFDPPVGIHNGKPAPSVAVDALSPDGFS